MKAGRRALLSAIALLCALSVGADDVRQGFGDRYGDAVHYVESRADVWCSRLRAMGADARVLVPAVFPEILKYTSFRDDIETLGLAVLYVSGGTARGNFSIGRFQMKPSFVEALETQVARRPALPATLRAITGFPGGATEKDRRTIRIERIRSEEWQLTYLGAFYAVVADRFDLHGLSVEEQVRFVSAAYNRGFLNTAEEIRRAEGFRIFPRGAGGRPGPYRYTDIAVDFFESTWDAMYAVRANNTGGSARAVRP